ncbi:MAG: ROK family protein [Ilumatobacteraceae bacterium]
MGDLYLAVDIGGTKLTAGIIGDDGSVLVRDRVPTPTRDVWPSLARLVLRVMAASPDRPIACGVACGGPLVSGTGQVSPLYIPSWRGFALRDLVEELTSLPVVLDTEAKAFASGQAWVGAGQGVDDFIGVLVATGVSGGIISGGRLLHGRLGNAGSLGHVVVEPEGRPCACGGVGCLDAYCTPASIEDETGRSPQRAPRAIMERTGTLVGRALAMVGATVDLRCAVIGGPLANSFGDVFFDALNDELGRRTGLSFLKPFEVRQAELGNHASLVGAGALARFSQRVATGG